MNAKICDRCGVYYQPKVTHPIYKVYKKVIQLSPVAEPRFEEIDLCPACKDSLKAWMDFYEGTKKSSQSQKGSNNDTDPWVKMSQSK